MGEPGKLLFTDFGKNHSLIKRQWIASVVLLVGYGFAFYNRWRDWQISVRFPWLWNEAPPSHPFFADLLILLIILVALNVATARSIKKMEIRVFSSGIEGYAVKTWGFLPRLRYFELKYDEIKSVKKHRWGVSIRSAAGRYSIVVHNPEIVCQKISALCGV